MAAIRFLSIPGFGNEGNEDVEKLLLLHSLLLSFLSSLSLSSGSRGQNGLPGGEWTTDVRTRHKHINKMFNWRLHFFIRANKIAIPIFRPVSRSAPCKLVFPPRSLPLPNDTEDVGRLVEVSGLPRESGGRERRRENRAKRTRACSK